MRHDETKEKTTSHRARAGSRSPDLVAHAMASAITRYPSEQIPLLDALSLLIQEPLAIAAFRPGPKSLWERRVYDTVFDPEIRSSFESFLRNHSPQDPSPLVTIPTKLNKLGFWTYRISHSRDNSSVMVAFLPLKRTRLAEVERALHALRSKAPADAAFEALNAEARRPTPGSTGPLTTWNALSSEQCMELLEKFRPRLDLAMDEAFDAALLNRGAYTNLFAVVRTKYGDNTRRRKVFDYTARVLLSPLQRQQIAAAFSDDKELINQIELPLGMTARSIADSTFASGVVEFSPEATGKGRDTYAGPDPDEEARRRSEDKVYQRIAGKKPRLFYMPIHVGGAPWISLFTLSRGRQGAGWEHNFLVYSSLVPQIADRIRQDAVAVYADLVAVRIARLLAGVGKCPPVSAVNEALTQLCQVFPFPLLQVSVAETSVDVHAPSPGLALDLGAANQLVLRPFQNPFFDAHVRYGWLLDARKDGRSAPELQYIFARCQGEVDRGRALAGEASEAANRRFLANVRAQEHKIFNRTGPLHSLATLSTDPELPSRLRPELSDAAKAADTIILALQIALERQAEIPDDVSALVRWLETHTLSSEGAVAVSVSEEFGECRFTTDEAKRDAFTVLWNLWHNAVRARKSVGDGAVHVDLEQEDARPTVRIRNPGTMPAEWKEFVMNGGTIPDAERSGLRDVRDRALQHGWQIRVEVDSVETTVVLTFTQLAI